MRTFKAHIYFQDEVPRIGCGMRLVTVKVGRQWLRLVESGTGKRAKLRRFPLDGATMRRFDLLTKLRMQDVREIE